MVKTCESEFAGGKRGSGGVLRIHLGHLAMARRHLGSGCHIKRLQMPGQFKRRGSTLTVQRNHLKQPVHITQNALEPAKEPFHLQAATMRKCCDLTVNIGIGTAYATLQ
ncbi:MAG: hypothetical protein IH624_08740 [Phycisphaerae bacterium]|nr:hypothetical protein [Phycisphaerae bacterium]